DRGQEDTHGARLGAEVRWGVPNAISRTRRETRAMGEVRATLFQPEFHRSLRVEAGAERLTADAGALLVCELTSGRRVLVVIDATKAHLRYSQKLWIA